MNSTALVAASLEHVARIARDVGALPEELRTLVDLVLDAAWSGATDLTIAAQPDDLTPGHPPPGLMARRLGAVGREPQVETLSPPKCWES